MSPTNHEFENQQLKEKIEKLQQKVDSYERAKQSAWKTRFFVAEKMGVFFLLGSKLKESLVRLLDGDISKDAIADVLIATLWRFTRIGLFAFFIAIVPIGILVIQTVLLNRQNQKMDTQNALFHRQDSLIELQNIRLDQQTALLEADRRSAVIFESGNVLDAVARELENKRIKKDSSLSKPLIGRIIALSKAMKPYKYLDPEADTLMKKAMSPERGHLLIALYNSRLDPFTYLAIHTGADFSKAELENADLREADLREINLRGANLTNAILYKADFTDAHLENAIMHNVSLVEANLFEAYLMGADLQDSRLMEAEVIASELGEINLQGANLQESNLQSSRLKNANLRNVDFRRANLSDADLSGAVIQDAKFKGCVLLRAKAHKTQIPAFLKAKADTTGMIWQN